MPAKPEYRDRGKTQAAVLDALVDRGDEGMTVLELRARVDADIDAIESALGDLKDDHLIDVERDGERTLIKADDRVVADGEEPPDADQSFFDWLRSLVGR